MQINLLERKTAMEVKIFREVQNDKVLREKDACFTFN